MATDIEKFLKAELALMKKCRHHTLNGWYTTGHFVLTHGRAWKPAPLPPKIRRMTAGECFRNAAMLAFLRDDLIYCEGYGLGLIPVAHAWCVDKRGKVIDPTWRNLGREYFGVSIRTEYLRAQVCDRQHYGLIDAWDAKWPLLHAKVEDWQHPLFANAPAQRNLQAT